MKSTTTSGNSGRTPRDAPDENPLTIGRADRIAVWIILIVGFFGGGLTAGLGLVTGILRLADPARYPVQLLAHIPIEAGPGIVQAHGDSILVNADGLAGGTVWLFALSDMASGIALGLVTASFSMVLLRVVQRKPFHRTSQIAALVAGSAIIFGSLLSQGLGGLAQMMAVFDLGRTLGDIVEPAFVFEPLPIVVGFGVLALAYVFQAGQRLQRDTEGLV